MITVVEQVFRFGAQNPDKIALINENIQLSYGGLIQRIVSTKKVLKEKYHIIKLFYILIIVYI